MYGAPVIMLVKPPRQYGLKISKGVQVGDVVAGLLCKGYNSP